MNDVQGWVHSWPCVRPVLQFNFDQFFTVLFRVEARGGSHLISHRRILSEVNLGGDCVFRFLLDEDLVTVREVWWHRFVSVVCVLCVSLILF